MALQKTVGLVPAIGLDGQEVVVGQSKALEYQPLSDGTVQAGRFVFKSDAEGAGDPFGLASATGAGEPLGICMRVLDAMMANVLATSTDVYPAGASVTVAVRGQLYMTVPEGVTATDGMKVLVNPASGAVNFAATAGEGEVDTGWIVRVPQGGASVAAGELAIVERY